jgi:hypothetical protein
MWPRQDASILYEGCLARAHAIRTAPHQSHASLVTVAELLYDTSDVQPQDPEGQIRVDVVESITREVDSVVALITSSDC